VIKKLLTIPQQSFFQAIQKPPDKNQGAFVLCLFALKQARGRYEKNDEKCLKIQ